MAEPPVNKAFQEFKLKEVPEPPVDPVEPVSSSVPPVALSPDCPPASREGQIPDEAMPPGPSAAAPQLFVETKYHGLLRHRLVVSLCILLALGVFALSALDLKPLIKTIGVIDQSLHIVPNTTPPILSPDLVCFGDGQPIEGLIIVRQIGFGRGIGFVDTTGKRVIEPVYYAAGDFSEGLANVTLHGNGDKPGKLEFIDKTGKVVIEPIYDYATAFQDGVAIASTNPTTNTSADALKVSSLIDKSGRVIFQTAKMPHKYSITVSDRNSPFDEREPTADGKLAKTPKYKETIRRVEDVFMVHQYDGKEGIIDKTGAWLLKAEYDSIIPLATDVDMGYSTVHTQDRASYKDSFFTVEKDGLFGLCNHYGKTILPAKFERILSFQNGHAAIKVGDKYGFCDSSGNIVIKPEFDFVTAYDKIIAVKKGNLWSFIDATGKPLAAQAVDGVIHSARGVWLAGGLGPVLKGNKVGYLNEQGQFAINPQFSWGMAFAHGFAPVFDGTYWHYIDTSGKRASRDLAYADTISTGKAEAFIPGPLYAFTQTANIEYMRQAVEVWARVVAEGVGKDEP